LTAVQRFDDKSVMRSPSAPAAARCTRRGAWLGLLVVASLAYGCSSASSPERKLQAAETAPYTRGGTASIDGRVVLRTAAGERPASIDTRVYMTPATTAALKRYQEYAIVKQKLPDRPQSERWWIARTDSQGRFQFTDLAAGEYILVSEIVWASPGQSAPVQTLAHARVSVPAGAKVPVVLTGDGARTN
jgi:hypothetical protein